MGNIGERQPHFDTGHLGFVMAPVTMIFLSTLWGWRVALKKLVESAA